MECVRKTFEPRARKWLFRRICMYAAILLLFLSYFGLKEGMIRYSKASREDIVDSDVEERVWNDDGMDLSKDDVSEDTNTPRKLQDEEEEQNHSNKEDTEATMTYVLEQSFPDYNKRLHWTIRLAGKYDEALFKPPPNEKPTRRLPQAIIIGAPRSGTRALINFLELHPYLVSCGAEVHFFDRDENFKKGLIWYLSRMPVSYSNQITMEKTPAYYMSARAVEEIYKLNKDMKLIVILQDPVKRAISHIIKCNDPDGLLRQTVTEEDGKMKVVGKRYAVFVGLYAKYLKMWFDKFQRSQIYVVEAKEMITEPLKVMQSLEQFLGLPPRFTEANIYFNTTKGFYCPRKFYTEEIDCLGDRKGMPHPELDPRVEKAFYAFYRKPNEELFELVGRRFQWEPKKKLTNANESINK